RVGDLAPAVEESAADPRDPVDDVAVDAVEVDRVRMRAGVHEVDLELIALAAADRRARYTTVVRPRLELDARHDLDLLVVRDELVSAQRASAGKASRLPPVEVSDHVTRVEAVHGGIDCRATLSEPVVHRVGHR